MKKQIINGMFGLAVLSMVGCGTILYPERKGQVNGRIDPAVAILDGLGLLLFLVPGVIAFAVDFSNGTIYLPNSSTSVDGENSVRIVKAEQKIDAEYLESLLEDHYGVAVDIDSNLVMVHEIDSLEGVASQIALFSNGQNAELMTAKLDGADRR